MSTVQSLNAKEHYRGREIYHSTLKGKQRGGKREMLGLDETRITNLQKYVECAGMKKH